MSEITFEELQERTFELYHQQAYAEALDLIDREADRFPGYRARIQYWRACFHSMQGQTGAALAALDDGLKDGLWFSELWLRGDSDLEALQGMPEFERIAAESRKRQDAAEGEVAPSREMIDLDISTEAPAPLLVALHGNNSNATVTAPYWQAAAEQGWRVLLPNSTQLGGPEGERVWDNRERSAREVRQHFDEVIAQHPFDTDQVIVGGFSMGAHMATWLALNETLPVTGFIAVGPWYGGDMAPWDALVKEAAKRELRAYLIIGDDDRGCYEGTLAMADLLKANGIPCQLKVYAGMRHVYPDDFAGTLPEALRFLSGE
jgi:dienelactone hydrolase